ncbi:hypothetical protein PCAR4_570175 [Paraburkholderia caribensis]|nr:hypothetical protein PCAR4_570175 [Paraburkholderia caribensis]
MKSDRCKSEPRIDALHGKGFSSVSRAGRMKASSGFAQVRNLIGSDNFPAKQVSAFVAASDLVRTQHVMTTVVDSVRVWLDYAKKSFGVDL